MDTKCSHDCKRGPSGSVWPCEHRHRIGESKHCRQCGCEIRLTKSGRWEHRQ